MSLFNSGRRPVLLLTLALTSACGMPAGSNPPSASDLKQGWNGANNPYNIGRDYERRLDLLPFSAEISKKPWADSYWPNNAGGIANRWLDPARPSAFQYSLPDRNTVFGMDAHRRALLSPAEKYDILQGRFDYPTVNAERQRTKSSDPGWYGLCHGLAPASVNYHEPKPATVKGAGGIEMYFGSSDVKALLIYAQSKTGRASFSGKRCDVDLSKEPWRANDENCKGVNAGTFHVVLANFVGRMQRGLVADLTRAYEVWNHPIFGYSSEKYWDSSNVYAGAAPGTVRVVGIRTHVRYIGSTYASWKETPFWEKRNEQEKGADYDYILELNRNGEIIGGEWKSFARPAFLWTQDKADFSGYLSDVNRIYAASQY